MRSSLMTGFCLALLCILSTPAFAQKIVIISDINGSYGSTEYHSRVHNAVEAIIKLKPDLVISAGDMVAGQKQPLLDQEHLDRMWASFNRVVADPLAGGRYRFHRHTGKSRWFGLSGIRTRAKAIPGPVE